MFEWHHAASSLCERARSVTGLIRYVRPHQPLHDHARTAACAMVAPLESTPLPDASVLTADQEAQRMSHAQCLHKRSEEGSEASLTQRALRDWKDGGSNLADHVRAGKGKLDGHFLPSMWHHARAVCAAKLTFAVLQSKSCGDLLGQVAQANGRSRQVAPPQPSQSLGRQARANQTARCVTVG